MKRILATLAVLAVLPAGAAFADNDCLVTPEQMQSWEAVAQLAAGYGWTITSMKLDDGCYEIDVTDTGGNSIEAKIDPATLDVIKAKMKEFAPEAPAPATPTPTPTPAN